MNTTSYDLPVIKSIDDLPVFKSVISGRGQGSPIMIEEGAGYVVLDIGEIESEDIQEAFLIVSLEHIDNYLDFLLDIKSRLKAKGFSLVRKGHSEVKQVYHSDIEVIDEVYKSKNNSGEVVKARAKRLFTDLVVLAAARGVEDIHIAIYPNRANIAFTIDKDTRPFNGDHNYTRTNVLAMIRSIYNTEADKESKATNDDFSEGLSQEAKIDIEVPDRRPIEVRFQSARLSPSGSKITLRLGGTHDIKSHGIDGSGYEDTQLELLKMVAGKNKGLTLVCGVVASGKTTTMHMLINEAKRMNPGSVFHSVEDPVELLNENIYQTPLTLEKGMTKGQGYTKALSVLLRSGVNNIFLGEIREDEQAEACVDAVLTGHGLFSTLHTMGAIPTITRLLEMGVKTSTLGGLGFLNAVIHQALLPKVCPHCSRLADKDEDSKILNSIRLIAPTLNLSFARILVSGERCTHCDSKGQKGKVLCSEIFIPDARSRRYIVSGDLVGLERYWLKEQDYSFLDGEYKGRSYLEHVLYRISKGELCPYRVEREWGSFALIAKEMEGNND